MKGIFSFGGIDVLHVLPLKQLNTNVKASCCRTSKRRTTRMNETVFGLDQLQTSTPWQTSCSRKRFSISVSNKLTLRIKQRKISFGEIVVVGQHLRHKVWAVIRNNPILERYNVGRLFRMVFRHAVKDLLNLVTKAARQVGQAYAWHELVMTVSRFSFVVGGDGRRQTTTVNRKISFKTFLRRKTLLRKLLHARNLKWIELWKIVWLYLKE